MASHEDLRKKIEAIERKVEGHDVQIKAVFDAIRSLMTPLTKEQRKIGFRKDR
ncbi:hypothetical protein KKG61_09010 [bacterium]|nr:hypothetical protein [bacterium]MBU1600221.1 hypothetical protein [bacterium]MBU2462259.1 hypothetical protein [bacterium]